VTNQILIFHKDRKAGEALGELTLTLKFRKYDTSNYLYVVDGREFFRMSSNGSHNRSKEQDVK